MPPVRRGIMDTVHQSLRDCYTTSGVRVVHARRLNPKSGGSMATAPRASRRAVVAGLHGITGLVLILLLIGNAQAATIPAGFAESQIASGLDPTTMTFAPDGRLFLCEKPGRV